MNASATFAKPLKLISIGNSTGVVIPKELLASAGLERGDELFPVSTPDGLTFRKYDPKLARQMESARRIMKKRQSALRELAK
ncbi:MAG: AbrB/MazE/SpoVT family DNA-binding domain-containing protein [Pacificimonas sp.]